MASYFEHNSQEEENQEKRDAADYFNRKRVKQLYRISKKATVANYKNHNIKVLNIRRDSLRKRIKFRQASQFYQANQIDFPNENNIKSYDHAKPNQRDQANQPYKRRIVKKTFYKKARNQKLNQLELDDPLDFNKSKSYKKKGIKELKEKIKRPIKNKIIRNINLNSPLDKIKVNKKMGDLKLLKGGKVGAVIYAAKKLFDMARKLVDDDQKDSTNDAMKMVMILALLPIIILLLLVATLVGAIASVITAIITFIINIIVSIISFIVSIFILKSYDMALAETYEFVTELDYRTNTAIYQEIESHKADGYDVRLYVNGSRSSTDEFIFYSNIGNMLYYFDVLFEENHLNQRISGPFGGTTVRQELTNMHDYYYNYQVDLKEVEIERTVLIFDDETEELREELQTEVIEIAEIQVTAKSFFEFLSENAHLLDEEQSEILEGSEALEQYEELLEYEELFDGGYEVEILKRYGYQVGQTNSSRSITLSGVDREWLYALTDLSITSVSNNRIVARDSSNRREFIFDNLEEVLVERGNRPNRGAIIGVPSDEVMIEIKDFTSGYLGIFGRGWYHINPSFYIEDLYYGFQTNLGQLTLGTGLMGDLINPPVSVTAWRQYVLQAAREYDIEEYVDVLLAIIWVESGGDHLTTPDIMQASESLTGQIGSIINPLQSINQGVRHFAEMLALARERGLSEHAALQAYNYGRGFLYHLDTEQLEYSFNETVGYAEIMSEGKRVNYNNLVAFNRGYRWRYQYGNMFYVDLVMQHIFTEDNFMVDIARNEIGYANGDKYWRWHGFTGQVEWSALFVSWVASQSGHTERGIVLANASAQAQWEWFKLENRYRNAKDNYIPRPGDIIFFDYDGTGTADHVGIIEEANTGMIMTIEGNVNNHVARRTYSIDDITVLGYGLTN